MSSCPHGNKDCAEEKKKEAAPSNGCSHHGGGDKDKKDPDRNFDWKGEEGEEFAHTSPTDQKGTDDDWMYVHGVTATDIVTDLLKAVEKEGEVKRREMVVLDIGCANGGVLNVFENLGVRADNLHGVDFNPAAVEENAKAHPQYKVKLVSGTDYEVDATPTVVFHSGVMCQVEPEKREDFMGKIKKLAPAFYSFVEAENIDAGEEAASGEMMGKHFSTPMPELVKKHLPDAKRVFERRIDHPEGEMKEHWVKECNVECFRLCVYKM